MKTYKLIYSLICLPLCMLAGVAANAQNKVPDMSRFSKAPIKSGGGNTAARKAFTPATNNAAAATGTLPSSQLAPKPVTSKTVVPAIADNIKQQLEMKPEAAPAKASVKPPANNKL